MKIRKTVLFSALTFLTANAFAQNTDAIINDYITATGGRDKIAQVKSMTIEGTMAVMGNTSPSTVTIVDGKGYKSEMKFNGQSIVQAVSDSGAWMINPMMGSAEATSLPKEQYDAIKDEIYIGGPLLNYKTLGYNISYIGTDTVDGKKAYKINATSKGGLISTFYIDSLTHLLDEKSVSFGGQTTSVKYSDYKKTDVGNLVAYKQEILVPQGITIDFTVNKVTVNAAVDPSVFKKP